MGKIVKLVDITKVYETGYVKYEALKGVNINIPRGSFISIVGPSGSGKTTLLNLIGCIDTPTTGKIYLENIDITSLAPFQQSSIRRKKIGFIFQSFNLLQALTVYENIEMPLLFDNMDVAKRKRKVEYYLETMGIKDVSGHRVTDISGGQQQRTAIARALVKDPLFVLADEPTGNLDSENGEAIMKLMKEINSAKGVTFIIATHDPMVKKYSSEIVKLRDGKVESPIP